MNPEFLMTVVPVVLHRGDRTPGVAAAQRSWNLAHPDKTIAVDGVFGPQTSGRLGEELFRDEQHHLVEARGNPYEDWELQVYVMAAIISRIEVGDTRDAFGFEEPDIGDGAGRNYGAWCLNARGSLREALDLLDSGGNLQVLLKTSEGARAQLRWFAGVVNKAKQELRTVGVDVDELEPVDRFRLLLVATDRLIQGGTLFSPYRIPAPVDTDWWDDVFDFPGADYHTLTTGLGNIGVRSRNVVIMGRLVAAVKDLSLLALGIGTLRAWASRPRYRRAVWSRVLTLARGHGLIHQTTYDLGRHYGLPGYSRVF